MKFYVITPFVDGGYGAVGSTSQVIVESDSVSRAKRGYPFSVDDKMFPKSAIKVPDKMQDWKNKDILEYYEKKWERLGDTLFFWTVMHSRNPFSRFNGLIRDLERAIKEF